MSHQKPKSTMDQLGVDVKVDIEKNWKDGRPHHVLKMLGDEMKAPGEQLAGYVLTLLYTNDLQAQVTFKHVTNTSDVNEFIVSTAVADLARHLKEKFRDIKHEWRGKEGKK